MRHPIVRIKSGTDFTLFSFTPLDDSSISRLLYGLEGAVVPTWKARN
jgi:hypothetical protein